jgi:hypothetical protein
MDHLFKDFPIMQHRTTNKGKEEASVEGFVNIPNKRKVGRKGNKPTGKPLRRIQIVSRP